MSSILILFILSCCERTENDTKNVQQQCDKSFFPATLEQWKGTMNQGPCFQSLLTTSSKAYKGSNQVLSLKSPIKLTCFL